MKENLIDIDYVANLARLEIKDEEKDNFREKLTNILGHFDKLKTINTDGIEAIAHPFPIYNVWQEDHPTPPMSVEKALQNAPQVKNNQVLVPKVVE